MIDYSDFGKLNEYDEIILNWKNDERAPKMRYVIIEDIESKCWIVYDSSTGLYKEVSFGEYIQTVINEFLMYDPKSVHHKKLLENAKKYNINYDEKEGDKLFGECKKAIDQLLELLSNLTEYRFLAKKGSLIGNSGNPIDSKKLDALMLEEWKKYRYLNFIEAWSVYSDVNFGTVEDIMDYVSDKSMAEEVFENGKEAAKEHEKTLHKIVNNSFVCLHDYIVFIDKNGTCRQGRCFITGNETYMFCWDLYHILVSRYAEAPHICPRCNHLFFSNNNKAIYCDKCKAEANILRNENRKKSVRYIHKKIYDKINNSKHRDKRELEMFLAESNYYWDIVKGKDVNQIPIFTEKIETEEDYKKWLEKKLNSL